MNLRILPFSRLRLLVALAALAFLLPAGSAQTEPKPDLAGNYIREEMQRQRIPGLALLVSRAERSCAPKDSAWRMWNCKSR